MDSTNFDAIEFRTKVSGKEKKRIRVYYQTADHKIRESCYDEDDGWFINGNGIVSSDARGSSPITVTRWIGLNDDVQIRVYFLDEQSNIRECTGQYAPNGTKWQNSTVLKPGLDLATGSQLAVARPDKDDTTLRVFYQEKGSNNYVREIRFIKKKAKWVVQGAQMPGALEGSRLAAVSDRKIAGIVRLYYQGDDSRLWEGYWNYDGCSQRKYIQSAFVLPAQAPISALSWYTDSGLQIRLFTVLNNGPNIAQILHEDNDWDDEAKDLVSLSPTVNAVAASRDVKASTDNAISVFYQNTRTAIDCLVTDPPRGIPTSRQS